MTISQELDGSAGENLRLESGRMPDEINLPKPERDQVIVVENDDLLEVRNLAVGESPARIALGEAQRAMVFRPSSPSPRPDRR